MPKSILGITLENHLPHRNDSKSNSRRDWLPRSSWVVGHPFFTHRLNTSTQPLPTKPCIAPLRCPTIVFVRRHVTSIANTFSRAFLKPTLDLTAPALDVWELRSLNLSDAESCAYCELFTQVSASDRAVQRMGGYPNQVQYSKLMSTDDGWQLLMQLDSEDEAGMMWGDVGKIYFTIREQDLKSLSFDKTWMNWQCS